MGICGLKGAQIFVPDAVIEKQNQMSSAAKKKKREAQINSSSERLSVGYHQITNTFNAKMSIRKQPVANDEGFNYNNVDADEVNRSNAGLVGLKNLGNTCFINSALQCLLNVQPLMDYFLSDLHEYEMNEKNPLGSQGAITAAFADLVNQVWWEGDKYFTPQSFLKTIRRFSPIFGDGSQQDSQEFLIFLLDYLHEDLNREKEKPSIRDKDYASKDERQWEKNSQEAWSDYLRRNRSVVVDLFQGQLKSTLKCLQCGAVSHKFETFMYLSVPISEENQQASHSLITIEDCIEEFTREETLDETEWWSCTDCKKRTPSTKKIDIWKTPNILIVHFKRFSYSKTNKGKINSFIDFKLTQFDLSSQVAGKEKVVPVYDLFAVCNHIGSLRGGHYTAYAKNRDYDEWYLFDDTSVTRVANANKTILSAQAYVLFYSKTSPEIFQRQTLTFPEFWPHIINPSPIIHPASAAASNTLHAPSLFQLTHSHSNCVHHHTIGISSNNNSINAGNPFSLEASHSAPTKPTQQQFTTICVQKEDKPANLRTPGFRGIRKGSSNYVKEVMSQLSLNGQLQESNNNSFHIQELEEENPELISPDHIPIWRIKDALKLSKQITKVSSTDKSQEESSFNTSFTASDRNRQAGESMQYKQVQSHQSSSGFSIYSFKRVGSKERQKIDYKSTSGDDKELLKDSGEKLNNFDVWNPPIMKEDGQQLLLNPSNLSSSKNGVDRKTRKSSFSNTKVHLGSVDFEDNRISFGNNSKNSGIQSDVVFESNRQRNSKSKEKPSQIQSNQVIRQSLGMIKLQKVRETNQQSSAEREVHGRTNVNSRYSASLNTRILKEVECSDQIQFLRPLHSNKRGSVQSKSREKQNSKAKVSQSLEKALRKSDSRTGNGSHRISRGLDSIEVQITQHSHKNDNRQQTMNYLESSSSSLYSHLNRSREVSGTASTSESTSDQQQLLLHNKVNHIDEQKAQHVRNHRKKKQSVDEGHS